MRAEYNVLGESVFRTRLFEREIRKGQEILVEDHLVVGILVAGDRGHRETAGVVAHREPVAEGRAAVGARVVVADLARADDRLPVVHDHLADVGIGIPALLEHRERQRIVDPQPRTVAPLRLPASAAHPLPVAFFARCEVLEESARMRVIARHGHAQVGVYPVIGRSPEPVAVAAAVFGAQADTLVCERRERVYVDDAAHRVAPVERRLRAPQHFDALCVGQFHVVIVLVQHRNVVDVEPHDRLVDPCPEPADVDRRGHARPVVGDVEVGDVLREVFQGVDMPPFDGAAADDGCRHGLRAQHHALFDGRYLYLVHHDHRVDARGVGLARVCGRFGCRIVFGRRVFPERGLPCVSCLSPDSRGASVYGLSCGCRLLCRPGLYFCFRLSLGGRTYRRGSHCREGCRRMPPRGSRQERQQQECYEQLFAVHDKTFNSAAK